MPTDLAIELKDRPGQLAGVGSALGTGGCNIEGGACVTAGDRTVLHVLVDDADSARRVLKETEFEVIGQRAVIVVDAEDRAGEIGRIAQRISDAGVNIELFYLATATRLVFGVDDPEAALDALP